MIEIYIRGHVRGTLQSLLVERSGELDAVVMTNHNYPFPDNVAEHCKSLLWLVFDDVTHTTDRLTGETPHIAPKKEHVESILHWAKGKDRIVTACHAGQSRSSAAAYLIACQAWGVEKAIGILTPHKHWPNACMVKYGSEVLDDKNVWTKYVEFYNLACNTAENDDFAEDIQKPDQESIQL